MWTKKARSKKRSEKLISVVSIGASGAGKSTIGNQLLVGSMKGPFETSRGVHGCTRQQQIEKRSNLVYTDLPGIPDTKRSRTKESYNRCVAEVRKGHTAILFVFKRGRINISSYEEAEILFMELSKAEGEKILVINDQDQKDDSTEEQLKQDFEDQANAIECCTHLNFDARIGFNKENMAQVLKDLAGKLIECELGRPTDLMDFDQLRDYVENLESKEVKRQADLEKRSGELKDCGHTIRWHIGLAAFSATVISGSVVASVFTFGSTFALAGAGYGALSGQLAAIGTLKLKQRSLKARVREKTEDPKEVKRLQDAAKRFQALAKVVEGAHERAEENIDVLAVAAPMPQREAPSRHSVFHGWRPGSNRKV